MIELCATHFAAQHPRELVVANRTAERGQRLAERFNGRAIPLSELPARMHEFDIIVSCTASSASDWRLSRRLATPSIFAASRS